VASPTPKSNGPKWGPAGAAPSSTGRILLLSAAFSLTSFAADPSRDYTSKVPHFTFGDDLPAQEAQLKDNPLMQRFRAARHKLAEDPFRPLYHFYSPEAQ